MPRSVDAPPCKSRRQRGFPLPHTLFNTHSQHTLSSTHTPHYSLHPLSNPQLETVDCKGVCNEPASKYIFRMALPSLKDALAGKWNGWQYAGGKPYEEMPWP